MERGDVDICTGRLRGRSQCQHKIEKAEAKLDDAIRKHGERSSQAESRRRDLNAERERCWNSYHGWWDAMNIAGMMPVIGTTTTRNEFVFVGMAGAECVGHFLLSEEDPTSFCAATNLDKLLD
jgi:hypothetical protein